MFKTNNSTVRKKSMVYLSFQRRRRSDVLLDEKPRKLRGSPCILGFFLLNMHKIYFVRIHVTSYIAFYIYEKMGNFPLRLVYAVMMAF